MKRLSSVFIFFIFFIHNLYSQDNLKPIFLENNSTWADSVLETLSLEERIAQLFMVTAYSNKTEKHKKEITRLIKKYKIGGLMFLQGGPQRQARLTNYYQSISKLPLMIAIDAEWGVAMRLDSALRFPWQMTLGASLDTNLIYEMGAEIARQCKLIGVNINFAPVVDINSNPKNPIINNRSFGENSKKVSSLSLAYMQGLQDNNILACAKHFPGHGDTDKDSHKILPVITHSKERIQEIELKPFERLIHNGLGSIMTAHLLIPSLDDKENTPVSLSKAVVSDLLCDDLGFKGLKFTDGLNMEAVSDLYDPGDLDVKALIAGNDVLLCAEDVPRAIKMIKEAIEQEDLSLEEIDNKCRKILLAKKWMNLDNYVPLDIEVIKDSIITPQTSKINFDLIKSSMTLLQNYDSIVPLERLDTLKIASLSIGEKSHSFQQMLNNYTKVDTFSIIENAGIKEQAFILDQLSVYNLVVVSVHKSNANAWKDYTISKNTDIFLQTIALQSKVVLTVFTNPYSINSFLFTDNFDAMLLGYQNSVLAQEIAAQAIFGGVSIRGSLPVSTKHFKINSGFNTDSIRLSYDFFSLNQFQPELGYKIDSIVKAAMEEKAIPGCQILIAKHGEVLFKESYGFHTYERKIKVEDSDIYDLASITKIGATVPVLMKLIDDDLFHLDSTLGDYLSLEGSNKNDLIIRKILAHQSRLTPWIPFYRQTLEQENTTDLMKLRDTLYSKIESDVFSVNVADSLYLHFSFPDSIIKQVIDSELLEQEEYVYSDLGYYLLKEIIEKVTGQDLDEYLEDNFYKKLGMENLCFLPKQRIDNKRIVPTEKDFEFRSQLLKGDVHDMGAAMLGGIGGHAGLFSNANDLAKIMQMYLQKGVYAGEYYLSESVINEFTSCQFCSEDNRRGVGFDKPALEDQEGGPTCRCVSNLSFGHTGFTGTLAWADPETGIIFIFLSNRIHPDAENKKLLDLDVRTNIMEQIFKYNVR
ncbi:MAG: glycoside hydrolase family 3 N-terminal domain-containing protein [Flavobacteriales bacterium]|nr:glycoside hydrolase family 3 N-terminal domain-containing protein [Flavobacteriales bacterium]